MQTETRSLLGLLIWISVAYPQISFATNKGCGFMANPSWSVNAFAKHIALHLYQYPVAVKWGGNKNIKSLVTPSLLQRESRQVRRATLSSSSS